MEASQRRFRNGGLADADMEASGKEDFVRQADGVSKAELYGLVPPCHRPPFQSDLRRPPNNSGVVMNERVRRAKLGIGLVRHYSDVVFIRLR
jgi:hypothetical protein